MEIEVSRNPRYHGRMKHIDVRHHFLRDCVENGQFYLKYIRTDEQVADLLTKALPRAQFENLRSQIGVSK